MSSHFNWVRERLSLKKKFDGMKTVNVFFGFFLIINYTLGTGFLGIPYAFFYAGFIAAIPTLLFITFISWLNANYLLEIMARAQVR
jgi:amino acid permease